MACKTSNGRGPVVLTGLLAAALTAGCQPPGVMGPGGDVSLAGRTLYVHEVAEQLGMRVIHTSYTTATLRGGRNTVVLYSEPDGEVYVNGASLPGSGGIVRDGDSLRVPGGLVAQIRSALPNGGGGSADMGQLPTPSLEEEPVPPPRGRIIGRVVIDPGHGGKDPGTTSVFGVYEKTLVLCVAKLVAAELARNGVEVRLTRTTDRFIELEDRPAIANRLRADLFVSIHADYSRNRAARGYTVYVPRSPSSKSQAAAKAICRRMTANGTACRGTRTAGFRVLVCSDVPAVLVELGYMSNRAEAAQLGSTSYQQSIAKALARGIYDYLRRN